MVLINHVMIVQVTVTVNNRGKASPIWKAHISHWPAWQAMKKYVREFYGGIPYLTKVAQARDEYRQICQENWTSAHSRP